MSILISIVDGLVLVIKTWLEEPFRSIQKEKNKIKSRMEGKTNAQAKRTTE
jgi:hypothetical protein